MSTPLQPKRMQRTPTPLMSERKKSLFGSEEQLKPRHHLPALLSESESDSDGRFLGVAALDSSSSSGDEREPSNPRTPTHAWRETRSHTQRLLKQNQDMFIKSPYMLRNFQNRFHGNAKSSNSTPATPEVRNFPTTPSSSHSTASACTESSSRGRARRSLASLIADTESCSSSLKDLTFDTDSATDSKENSPSKSNRKSTRTKKMTPKFSSFKGILSEQKVNTDMDCSVVISPMSMMKTPHSTSQVASPPKLSHSRRPVVQVDESPDDSNRGNKRPWNDSIDSDSAPNAKSRKIETQQPKARLSLFNSDKLKDILSTKSFYGKTQAEVPIPVANKISKTVVNTESVHKRHNGNAKRRHRLPGQINSGVRHKIRRPKMPRYGQIIKLNMPRPLSMKPLGNAKGSVEQNNQVNAILEDDKADPFDKEHQTIDALLSQWTEEEVPPTEPRFEQTLEEAQAEIRNAESLLCFNKSVIEESGPLINPNEAVPVGYADLPTDGQGLTDLDAMERELAILDGQIENLKNTRDNVMVEANKDAEVPMSPEKNEVENLLFSETESPKVFPIFYKRAMLSLKTSPASPKDGAMKARKMILKSTRDQYVIDAGQKKFGATLCKECGVIYQIGDPQDEHDHLVHHNAVDILRFNGWRGEVVVGVWGESRCIAVRADSELHWRRVAQLLERVVHPQLGYTELPMRGVSSYTAYLFINKKQIVGCAVVEPKERAHRLIQDGAIDCCSVEAYPVKCGISRIWTHISHRRRGVATRVLNCVRTTFLYGEVLGVDDVAFSAPTQAGRALAANYTKRPDFLIYLE